MYSQLNVKFTSNLIVSINNYDGDKYSNFGVLFYIFNHLGVLIIDSIALRKFRLNWTFLKYFIDLLIESQPTLTIFIIIGNFQSNY